MPRPRRKDRVARWKLSINEEIAAKVDLYMFDPITLRPRYGERSRLVEQLLTEWLESKEVKEPT